MQGIVIQGPINYYKEIVECYENIHNTVVSTWEDEPEESIKYIESFGIPVILNKKPSFPGYLNINMQTTSAMGGIKYLEEKGITEILKTRGDISISNIDKFLKVLKGKDMSFLAIATEGVRKDLYYELVYQHFSHDYPVDLVIYGTTENIKNSFNFLLEENAPIPPEALVAYGFTSGKGIDFKLDYSYLIEKGVNFYLQECLDNNIELLWLKNNNVDIVKMHNDKEKYGF